MEIIWRRDIELDIDELRNNAEGMFEDEDITKEEYDRIINILDNIDTADVNERKFLLDIFDENDVLFCIESGSDVDEELIVRPENYWIFE